MYGGITASMTSQTRSRVAANVAVGTASQITAMVIGLFTTPLILGQLGRLDYGAFALIGSLSAYFGVLDFGIGGGLTRFMSFHHERGDHQRISTFAVFGLLFYIVLGIVLLPLLLAAAPAMARFLRLPADLQAQFPGLLTAILGLFMGWSISGIIVARLTASHRLDLAAYANVAGSLVFAVLIFFLLPMMPTVGGVFVCMAGQLLFVMVTLWLSNRLVNGPLVTWPLRWHWADTRELFVFGLWTQLASVTAVVNLEADKAIISRSVGVASVTPYQVANRLALLSRALPLQLLASLLPAVTARVSQGISQDEVVSLYARTSRHLMIPTLVIAGFVVAAADPLLRLWLGQHMPGAASLCMALVSSYAINNVTGAGTTILRAQGRPQLETFYGVLSAVLNVGLTIVLIGPFGLDGVVMGTIGGNVIGSSVFIVLFHRREVIAWWPTIGRWLTQLLLTVAGAGLITHYLLAAIASGTNRLTLLPPVAAGGLVYLLVVFALGWLVGLWTVEDRALLYRVTAFVRRRRPQVS
jgi:O-antigen/teichoic acid export membrane protein